MPASALVHSKSWSKWIKFSRGSSTADEAKRSDSAQSANEFGALEEKSAVARQYGYAASSNAPRPSGPAHTQSLRVTARPQRRSSRVAHSLSDNTLPAPHHASPSRFTYHPTQPSPLSLTDVGPSSSTTSSSYTSLSSASPSSPSLLPSAAHPSPNVLPNPIPEPYQNHDPPSKSAHSHSHVPNSNAVSATQHQTKNILGSAKLAQKPLPPIPSPHQPPHSRRPSSSYDHDDSSLGHSHGHHYASTDVGHHSPPAALRRYDPSYSDIGHSSGPGGYTWTDLGHAPEESDYHYPYSGHSNPNYHFSLDDFDDLAPPHPTFASSSTPSSSSSTLSAPRPHSRHKALFGRKAHSDIGHGAASSSSAPPHLATHVPRDGAAPSEAHAHSHSACPPSFGRHSHSFLASDHASPRRKLRKHPPSASASASRIELARRGSSMDVSNIRPASMVVSPMGPPMLGMPSFCSGKAHGHGYQEKRPAPLPLLAGKDKRKDKENEVPPKKPGLMRRWTLTRPGPAMKVSSSSASASNEDSASTHDASASTSHTGITTPDSGEMEFALGARNAVSECGHGGYRYGYASESTVGSPRASLSMSVFTGETVAPAQMVGGKRVSRKLTKRRRPSTGAAPTTPVTPYSEFAPGSVGSPGSSTVEFQPRSPWLGGGGGEERRRKTPAQSFVESPTSIASPPSRSPSSGWLSGGEGERKRKLKKRRPNDINTSTPASPVDAPAAFWENLDAYPHPLALDMSSSSYAAASAAMSPVASPTSPTSGSSPFSSSVLSLGRASNKAKSKSRLTLNVSPGPEEGGARQSGSGEGWDPYEGSGGKGKGTAIERRILEPGEYALPGDAGDGGSEGAPLSPPPPPRLREAQVRSKSRKREELSRPGSPDTEEGAMRRWTMAFGDEEEEGAGFGGDRVRSRTSTKTSRGGRSRAGSAVMSMMSRPEGNVAERSVGEEEGMGIELEEMGGAIGIALTTSQEGSLRSSSRWRCSYDPRGSGMVYGAQDEEDEEHEDDDEDEVWGDGREEWLEIKKAKMCCRELVRTERNYLRCLRDLIDGETQTPPSPLLLAYLPALLAASNSFLAHLVSDPTPYGVSAAFLGCEDEMEAAFVAWCGIVGCVFADGTPSSRGRKAAKEGLSVGQRAKSGFFGKGLPSGEGRPSARSVSYVGTVDITGTGMFTAALGSGLKFPLAPLNVNAVAVAPKKSASSWRKSMPALGNFVVTPSNGSSSNSGASTIRLVGKRKHQKSGSTFFFASVENDGDDDSGKEKEKRKKRPTVRDLAIQPVQRVMRYVLQYKDLLNHTPASSPARALVERALEGATRIAAKCDRAQDNAAFLR